MPHKSVSFWLGKSRENNRTIDNRVIIEVNQIVFQSMKKSPPPNLANDYFVTRISKETTAKMKFRGGLTSIGSLKTGEEVFKWQRLVDVRFD